MDKKLYVYCPRCNWKEKATIWNVDFHDNGGIYPIIVCPKCYAHVHLTYIFNLTSPAKSAIINPESEGNTTNQRGAIICR